MSDRRSRSARNHSMDWMVGWLFADLMIVLFIVALGTNDVSAGPSPARSPTPTAKPSKPTPTPTVIPSTPGPPGIATRPATYTIQVAAARILGGTTADRSAELRLFRDKLRAIAQRSLAGRQAGIVLVWAESPDVNRGMRLAALTGSQLKAAHPQVFRATVPRTLWKGGGSEGRVVLEIYLFNQ